MREIKKNLIGARIKVTSLLVLLVSVFLLSALAGVELFGAESAEGPYDWPMFHHDVINSGYSESPAPNTNQTLWNYTTGGQVYSSPAVVDGRVYFGAFDNNVYCLDAATGAQIWNYTAGNDVFSSPTVVDGNVYVGSNGGSFYCLDALTGALIWNYTTGGQVRSCPAVADGKVYFGSGDNNTYCLDAATGAQIWNYTTGAEANNPAFAYGVVYIGSFDDTLYCLDGQTGDLVWNYTTDSDVIATAVVDGKVYFGSGDFNVYCLDAANGEKIWNYTTGNEVWATPGVAYGKVYVGSSDNNVYCLDANTGVKIWNSTIGGSPYVSSPAVASGKVYVNALDKKVYCLDAANGNIIWSYETGGMLFYSSPAVANGVVYVSSADWKVYAFSDSPPLTGTAWSRTYGGTGEDMGTGETVQTSDGGCAISGDTNSWGAGGFDFWLFKTDADGDVEWNQTYGGALNETIHDMCQTSDEGYLMSGTTESFGAGGTDAYLVKTDADGNLEWNMTYGGAGDENGRTVIQTSDGGYTMTGRTNSSGSGGFDGWLIKTDGDGNMEWNMTYGGTGDEDLDNVVQTDDGGYLFAGQTNSFGAGDIDGWLVKTDASGNMEWNQTYGGTGIDITYTITMSGDGGYALTGFTTSFGSYKVYLVKTDEDGNMMWNQTYSTSVADIGIHGIPTSDGGYAIIGWNYANGQDFVLYKTNATGDLEWNMTYGGTGLENGYALLQTEDGGYVLTGTTDSFGAGGSDVWLVKVDGSGVIPESFPVVVVVLLSTAAVVVSFSLLPKRSKWKKYQG